MKLLLQLLICFVSTSLVAQNDNYLLVGTYTGGKSNGIYVYKFNSNGSARLVDSAVTLNPSYLAVSPGQDYVYAVNEMNTAKGGGQVTAYRFNKSNGHLTELNQQPSGGDDPCYITVDKTGRWAIVGNYSSGTLAVLPIQKDGKLAKATTVIQHYGQGPNLSRQEKPHVHSTVLSPDNRFLYVGDLGIDKVMIYSFDSKTGNLVKARDSVVNVEPGSGPRHFVFDPSGQHAYLVQELSGKVISFNYSNGHLKEKQEITTLPASFTESFTSADIHVSPDGRFLYSSNRDQSNTIAIFSIDPATGMLSIVGHQSTLGKTPRNFNFDPTGKFLLVANQNSDQVVVFKVDKKTGKLTDSGNRIDVGKPVCIKWISK